MKTQLLAELQSPAPVNRWAAATVVRRKKGHFPDELLELVCDEDSDVRQEVRRTLVSLADGVDYGPEEMANESEIAEATKD